MPISWTAEVDQRLFQTTMDVCGVTINGSQYEEIAEKMGDGFTVEALKHRFRRIKSQSGKAGGGSGTPRKGGTTPKAVKTGGTPRAGRGKKQVDTDTGTGDDSGNGEKKLRASPRKRAAKSYAEAATDDEGDGDDPEEPESPTKKVKHEKKDDDAAGRSFFDQDEEV